MGWLAFGGGRDVCWICQAQVGGAALLPVGGCRGESVRGCGGSRMVAVSGSRPGRGTAWLGTAADGRGQHL